MGYHLPTMAANIAFCPFQFPHQIHGVVGVCRVLAHGPGGKSCRSGEAATHIPAGHEAKSDGFKCPDFGLDEFCWNDTNHGGAIGVSEFRDTQHSVVFLVMVQGCDLRGHFLLGSDVARPQVLGRTASAWFFFNHTRDEPLGLLPSGVGTG